MTIAAYNVAEQQLAGVVVNHLYEGTDYDPEVAYENANYLLPIRDVFWQMINNNIISVRAFADEDASATEHAMEQKRIARKAEVTARMKAYLQERDTTPVSEEDRYMRDYIGYLYTYMVEKNYIRTALIDTEDSVYKQWKAEEISFPVFFRHAIAAGWVDTAILSEDNRYNSVDTCYDAFADLLLEQTTLSYGGFDKLIYSELIHTDRILGTEIGIALYEQGVLREDRETYEKLLQGDNAFAFEFFKSKINSMEITPAQIALDPCSAGVVLADPNTGRLLAVVSYPGYDANRINDAAYYSKLLSDSSSPLYSYATQSRIAPGSTFKMVTTTAALEGGYVGRDEKITCEGIFPNLDHPRCWIYRLLGDTHGELDFVHAIGQSCNCFFYECGYRLSMNAAGLYSPSTGINALNSYASMYGFGSLSGIEVRENVPTLTTELPVTSAIGQGTYAFTTISLARYVTTIASSGNLYEFKLLDHIADPKGEEMIAYAPKVISKLELKDSTWDAIHSGMYMV
ncbi:MAG: penicillin-binding protein, partial [Lachnospiraceae bacterium]|nr:penicillin-binding protein [Lachnospiraceae bacterium]